jgi:hypothetical protein
MAAQWDPRQRPDNRAGEPAAQQTHVGTGTQNAVPGRQPFGQPITRVDFFRRMPTGGATAYFKPTDTEA